MQSDIHNESMRCCEGVLSILCLVLQGHKVVNTLERKFSVKVPMAFSDSDTSFRLQVQILEMALAEAGRRVAQTSRWAATHRHVQHFHPSVGPQSSGGVSTPVWLAEQQNTDFIRALYSSNLQPSFSRRRSLRFCLCLPSFTACLLKQTFS